MTRGVAWLARACRSRSSRSEPRPGSGYRPPTWCATRTAAPRPSGSESSPAVHRRSSSWAPDITRSWLSRRPSQTSSLPPPHVADSRRAAAEQRPRCRRHPDLDGLLAVISEDVDRPRRGADLAPLRGRTAVRAYSTERWAQTRTHDEPIGFCRPDDGQTLRAAVTTRMTVVALRPSPAPTLCPSRSTNLVRALHGSVLDTGVYNRVPPGQGTDASSASTSAPRPTLGAAGDAPRRGAPHRPSREASRPRTPSSPATPTQCSTPTDADRLAAPLS